MSAENNKTQGQEERDMNDLPITVLAQYVRDMSFENPNATDVLRSSQDLPQMDINIGMDARKLQDDKIPNLYEVVLNIRAVANTNGETIFIAELQYGITVSVATDVPEETHHPILFIEIPRLAFPFARQILSNMTVQGGYPPLLLNPVNFQTLYMQRFAKEIEEAKQKFKQELKDSVGKGNA